jgi:hypothetical protein
MQKKSTIKTAFSLLELSMVILILGFLILAIATGKNIIDLTKVTKARVLTQSSIVNGTKNLVFWVEASSNKSFTVEDPSDGTAISTWNDINPQLTLKNNAVAGNSPTYTRSAINGIPALKFNGTSNYLTVSNLISNTTGLTAFVVCKRIAVSADTGSFTLYNTAVSTIDYDNAAILVPNYEGAFGSFLQSYRNAALSNSSHPGNNIPYIFTTVFDGTNNIVYLNGVAGATAASTGTFNISNISIGSRYVNGFSNFYNGYIGEIIIFDRALSTSERQQIEQYLSKKWNITVT